jgi:hypothetical protein
VTVTSLGQVAHYITIITWCFPLQISDPVYSFWTST